MATCGGYNVTLPEATQAIIHREAVAEAAVIREGLERHCAAKDLIGAASFCERLRRFLRFKYVMTADDKAQIVQWLLPLIADSQTPHVKVEYFAIAVHELIRKKDRLSLSVDWRPLFKLVTRLVKPALRDWLSRPSKSAYECQLQLRILVIRLRRYFAVQAPDEIVAEIRPWLCIHSESMSYCLGYLSLFLPITEAHPHAWLPELLAIWGTDDTTPFLDHCLLSLLSRLAEEKYLLVDWRPHLPLIFGHVLRVFDLPVSRGGGDTNYDHCAGASDHPMFGCRGWSLGSVHSEAIKHASRLIVWLLGGGEGGEAALLHLQQLVRSLEGFYHPSSVHDRSTELASLLVFLPAEMVARTEREAQRQLPERDRLQQPLKDALVEMWTPIALLGMQGKSARCAQVALEYLAILSPQKLFPLLTERALLVFGMDGTPGLRLGMLGALQKVLGRLLEYDATGQFLAELFPHIVDGIDPNDPKRAHHCLAMLYSLSSQMVFSGEGCGPRTALAPALEDVACALVDRGLDFFAGIADRGGEAAKRSSGAVGVVASSRTTFEAFFQALSPALLAKVRQKVLRAFSTSIHSDAKPMAMLVRALCTADPDLTLKSFVPVIHHALTSRGALRDDVTEKELFWNVDVLCALCIRAGPALLEHEAAVCDVLTGLWGSSAKVRVRLGAKLLKRLLQCLTTTYHLDLRMAAPAEWRTAAFQTGHGQHWGRRCTREAAAVDWHVPTAPEVRCAVRLVNRYYAASRAVLEAYLTGGDAAGAGAGAGAGADEEDTSPLNRCRCALKQIKKLVQGAVALLPDPPDGEFPRAPDAVPNPRLHCSMISEQDFGAEDPLSELQCTRHDIAELMCRVIEHGGAAPDVDAMSKCCKVIRVALCGLGWGSTRGPKLMANAAALATWKVPDPTGTKRQPRVYHVLRSAILLQHRAALLPSKGVAYSAVHGRCYAALLRLATGAYARLRTCAQSAAGALLSNTPRAVRVRLIAGMIGGLREARDADGLKGTVFLLKKDLVLRVLCQHLDLVVLFLEAICEVPDVPDEPALRGKVDRLHKAFRQTFAGLHFADDQDHGADAKRRAYSALLQRLVAKAGEPDLKWQTKLIIAHSVRLLLAWAPRGTPEYRLPPCVLEYCLQTPLSDQPYIRQVATKALMVLMRLLKPLHPRRPVPAPELSPSGAPFLSRDDLLQMAARAPASEEAFDAAAFVDKSAFGFCAMPTVAVLDRDAGGLRNGAGDGISRQLEGFRGLLLQTLTPEYMGQFMHLFCLDYSGHSDSDQYLAQVFKGFFQIAGPQLFDTAEPVLQRHLQCAISASRSAEGAESEPPADHDESAHLLVVADCLTGLLRASKHWRFADLQRVWPATLAIWRTAVEKVSTDGYDALLGALRQVVEDLDPRRFCALKAFWLQLLREQDAAHATYSIATHSRVLYSVLTLTSRFAWRDPALNQQLLALTARQLDSPYEQIREVAAALIASLYVYDYPYVRNGAYVAGLPPPHPDLLQTLREARAAIAAPDTDRARAVAKTLLTVFSFACVTGRSRAMQPVAGPFLAATVEAFAQLYDESDAELAALLNTTVMEMAAVTYSLDAAAQVVALIGALLRPADPPPPAPSPPPPGASEAAAPASTWRARHAVLKFVQTFAFRNQTQMLADGGLDRLLECVPPCLREPRAEVQDEAVHTIALLVQIGDGPRRERLQGTFEEWCRTVVPRGALATSPEVCRLMGGCLGLWAIVRAFPHTVPAFVPGLLCRLARHANGPFVGKRVSKAFGEWWSSHQDMWQMEFQAKFTEEELRAVREVMYSPVCYV